MMLLGVKSETPFQLYDSFAMLGKTDRNGGTLLLQIHSLVSVMTKELYLKNADLGDLL